MEQKKSNGIGLFWNEEYKRFGGSDDKNYYNLYPTSEESLKENPKRPKFSLYIKPKASTNSAPVVKSGQSPLQYKDDDVPF